MGAGRNLQGTRSMGAMSRSPSHAESLVSLVRREVEASEQRYRVEMSSLREKVASSLEKMDKLREAALGRVEHKVVNHETQQCKLDRKVSELSGAFRGLTEELQLQIKRADAIDSRMWDMTHCRTQVATLEEQGAEFRALVNNVEAQVQERAARSDALHETVADIQNRLDQAEVQLKGVRSKEDTSAAAPQHDIAVNDAKLWRIEQQLGDLASQCDSMRADAHGDCGWDAKLKEHDVRLASLRQNLENVEHHWRNLDEQSRADWESRHAHLQRSVKDLVASNMDRDAQIQGIVSAQEALVQEPRFGIGSGEVPQAQTARLQPTAQHWGAHQDELAIATGAYVDPSQQSMVEQACTEEISSRLAQLVDQLHQVAPKVLEHENLLNALPAHLFQANPDSPVSVTDLSDALEVAREAKESATQAQLLATNALSEVLQLRDSRIAPTQEEGLAEGSTLTQLMQRVQGVEDQGQQSTSALEMLTDQVAKLAADLAKAFLQLPKISEEVEQRFDRVEADVRDQAQAQAGDMVSLQRAMQELRAATSSTLPMMKSNGASPMDRGLMALAHAAGVVSPSLLSPAAAQITTSGEDLDELNNRVEESEMECAQIQAQLVERIAMMDQLLDNLGLGAAVPSYQGSTRQPVLSAQALSTLSVPSGNVGMAGMQAPPNVASLPPMETIPRAPSSPRGLDGRN